MESQVKQSKKTPVQVYLNERELRYIANLKDKLLEDGIEKSYSSIIRESFILNSVKGENSNE